MFIHTGALRTIANNAIPIYMLNKNSHCLWYRPGVSCTGRGMHAHAPAKGPEQLSEFGAHAVAALAVDRAVHSKYNGTGHVFAVL